ncbi:MAG: hypothetical protein ACM335_09145, partial [Deltaproteobacteria bacterium]
MSNEIVLNHSKPEGTLSPHPWSPSAPPEAGKPLPQTWGKGKGEGEAWREWALLRIVIGVMLALLVSAGPVFGKSYLLYLEAQGVVGYDTAEDEAIYYSMNPLDEMQKPSVGFDYVQRFSGEAGDWGTFALQMRLAYNEEYRETEDREFQVQFYNAFFKYKAGFADLWIGHNRIAFGLASYLDSHALLLQPLAFFGYGYDRDWGVGATRDFDWGNVSLSYSTGTGMPIE